MKKNNIIYLISVTILTVKIRTICY